MVKSDIDRSCIYMLFYEKVELKSKKNQSINTNKMKKQTINSVNFDKPLKGKFSIISFLKKEFNGNSNE